VSTYALHKFSENSLKLQMLNSIGSLTAKAKCSPTRLDYSEGQGRKLIGSDNKVYSSIVHAVSEY